MLRLLVSILGINMILGTAAYATAPASPATASGGGLSFLILFMIFFAFIYLMIWRPQNKRAREQQALLESLAKDDEIITASGTLGRITAINGPYITVSIAQNVEIMMQKSAIITLLPKGTLQSIQVT